MPCDVCNSSHANVVVKPEIMSRAVKQGFNPFTLGLIPAPLAKLATPEYPAKWSRQAMDGILSRSDWTICDTCLPKLTPYLKPRHWWHRYLA
jgi:hypothetical protein